METERRPCFSRQILSLVCSMREQTAQRTAADYHTLISADDFLISIILLKHLIKPKPQRCLMLTYRINELKHTNTRAHTHPFPYSHTHQLSISRKKLGRVSSPVRVSSTILGREAGWFQRGRVKEAIHITGTKLSLNRDRG